MPIKYLNHLIALLRFIYNQNELLKNIKYFNLIIPPQFSRWANSSPSSFLALIHQVIFQLLKFFDNCILTQMVTPTLQNFNQKNIKQKQCLIASDDHFLCLPYLLVGTQSSYVFGIPVSWPGALSFKYLLRFIINFSLKKLSLTSQAISLQSRLTQSKIGSCEKISMYFLKGTDPNPLSSDHQRQIADLVAQDNLSTSLLIYNPAQTTRRMTAWKNALPWIQPHYAIKACPSMDLIRDLALYGAGMDCASKPEIELALQAGVTLDNIVYSNPIKAEKDLLWAGQAGVKLTVADTYDQLEKITEYAPNIGILWRIAIKQVSTDKLSSTFSGKFGDDIEEDSQIQARMKEIAQMGINLKGIHFHCGTGMQGSSGFGKAITLAKKCMEIGRKNGHEMHTLDIGGGFPAGDLPEKTINALKPTQNDPLNYRVIAEPGRHLCSRSFYVATRIIGKRTKNNQTCYHLNESVYHSFNNIIMDDVCLTNMEQFYSKLENGKTQQLEQLKTSTLFGMTCDGLDVISKNIGIPVHAKVGDWFCFGGMGSYTIGSKTQFNGMLSTEKLYKLTAPVKLQPVEEDTTSSDESFTME